MEIDKNDSRLIGNFIEINADILSEQINSKRPKFIANIIAKRQRKRLLKLADKLSKSGVILDKSNLAEFFTYVHSHYEGKYGIIKNIIISGNEYDYEISATVIIDDDIRYIITITEQREMQIVCNTSYKTSNGGFNTFKTRLYSERPEYREYIELLNKGLREELFRYIREAIGAYSEKGKNGYVDNKEFI